MTDDRRYEGEYPGQEGLPFDEGAGDPRPADGAGPGAGERRSPGGSDDDLFVWNDLRPPARGRDEGRRPAASGPGDRRTPESAAPRSGARDGRPRRPSGDWRAPEYPTGAGRPRYEPADGYETSEEWEEWLEPDAPHGPETIGPLPERHKGPRRRRLSAGAVLLAMLLGFFLAGLLDANNIKKDVEARPYGALRTFQLAMLTPMTALSGALRADQLGAAVADALGRGEQAHHTLAEVKPAKKPLWPRTITQKKPLRLYVAGDSMDQVFGSSLVNLGEATGLVKGKNDYHVSSGLSRPDFFDWPQRLVDQIVDFKPDAAAVLFGANDGQDVLYEGKVLKVGTKAWQEVYAERVGEAMDVLTKGGRRVYWVGNPIMRDFGYRERVSMMNHIYQAEAAKHPGVTFVSTWRVMANDKGSYSEYLKDANGDSVLMRAPDGIHLTRAGGDRMAALVLGVIEKDWGMTGPASPSPAP